MTTPINKQDADAEEWAWQAFCAAHPKEAHEFDRERFRRWVAATRRQVQRRNESEANR